MSKLKAIETIYRGFRFRSRLEARWAVFFDTLGIEYRYEEEGYELDDVWYLPDFYIPSWQCFIEIKGYYPNFEHFVKSSLLSQKSQKRVILLHGDVWPYQHGIIIWDHRLKQIKDSDIECCSGQYMSLGTINSSNRLCIHEASPDGEIAINTWSLGESVNPIETINIFKPNKVEYNNLRLIELLGNKLKKS